MGDSDRPVQRDEFARVKLFAQIALVVGLATAAVGLLIGAGVIRIPRFMSSTEEPPIRVRNGSQDVIATNDTWDRDVNGNDKKWHLMKGTYNHKHLKVLFYYAPGKCDSNFASTDKLTIEYTIGTSTNLVRITQPGHMISVDSDNNLTRNPAQDVVSFGQPDKGWISKVYIGQNDALFCHFDSEQDLGGIDIVDW